MTALFESNQAILVGAKDKKNPARDMNLPASPPNAVQGDNDADSRLRNLIHERQAYGVRLTAIEVSRIGEIGYTSYFVRLAASIKKIGGRDFKRLRLAGRLELTTEYILFHDFREYLNRDMRQRIAALLAESVSHPDARFETKSSS